MKLNVVVLTGLLAALFVMVTGCEDSSKGPLVPENYARWDRLTNVELNYTIPGHLGHYRIAYINEIGKRVTVVEEKGRRYADYPDGTMIVKEIYSNLDYTEGDSPVRLTVMIKDRDHPDQRGGWIWIGKNMGMMEETVITEEFCVTCHGNANKSHPYGDENTNSDFRDFVFFPYKD